MKDAMGEPMKGDAKEAARTDAKEAATGAAEGAAKQKSGLGLRTRLLPFALSAVLLALDQMVKALVVAFIPLGSIRWKLLGDFLWIVHVRNTGAAFSMGAGCHGAARIVLLILAPACLMGLLCWAIATPADILSKKQRYLAAGILGGGLGTLADRIFRFDLGVVDFISVKFYGLFGLERWPTFNISDSCVVVFVTLFALSVAFGRKRKNAN